MKHIEDIFKSAAAGGRLVMLKDNEGYSRIVEPYMIYNTAKGKRCFHVYQRDGFSLSGKSTGWKNPEIESFISATILDDRFEIRPEYNPSNRKMFPDIDFNI